MGDGFVIARAHRHIKEVIQKDIWEAYNNNDYRRCLHEIERISDSDKDFLEVSVPIVRAECKVYLGRYDEAFPTLKHHNWGKSEDEYIRGMICYFKNDLEAATAHMLQSISFWKTGPGKNSELLSNLRSYKENIDRGNALMKNKLFDDALSFFTQALAVDQRNILVNSDLYFKRAQCYLQLGNRQRCLDNCDSALQLVPGSAGPQKLRNACQAEVDDLEKEKNIEMAVSNHISMGEDFRSKCDWHNAIVSYTRAIDLNPIMASNYSKRAKCYLFMEEFEATMCDARKSTELDAGNFEGYICEAMCYISTDNMESGMDVLNILENAGMMKILEPEQLLEIFNLRKIPSLLAKASSCFRQKKHEKCQQLIEAAFENMPHSMPYKIMRTECLIRLFNLDEALQIIHRIKLGSLEFLKGLFYYYNDDYETAINHLKMYSSLNQTDEEAEHLLALSKKMLQIIAPGLPDSYDIILEKINSEIDNTFMPSNVPNSSEIRMRLYYQRALLKQKMNQHKESLRDCTLALVENPRYYNALKLKSELDGTFSNNQSTDPSKSEHHQIFNNHAPVQFVGGDYNNSPHIEHKNRIVNKNNCENTTETKISPKLRLGL